jgi:hypothetical protein
VANGSHIGHSDPRAMVYMLIVFAAALLVPALIARFSRGSSDSDGNGGDGRGGGGPRRPPPEKPGPPSGGPPLDQSQPARIRLRDGRRLAQRLPAPARRPVREPARRPARTAPTNRCPATGHGPPCAHGSRAARARTVAPRPTRRTSPGPAGPVFGKGQQEGSLRARVSRVTAVRPGGRAIRTSRRLLSASTREYTSSTSCPMRSAAPARAGAWIRRPSMSPRACHGPLRAWWTERAER